MNQKKTDNNKTLRTAGSVVKRLVRRFPVDFKSIAKESGLRKGKLCFSPIFGWCVQNTHNILGPSVGCITAPEIETDQLLEIKNDHWCVYSA